MMSLRIETRALAALAALAITSACEPQDLPPGSYFEDNIQPTFQTSCVRQNTGCHLATPQGTATGNLDISSYDSLMRRRDVLEPYGPYPLPLLLMKPGQPVTIHVETFGETDGAPLEMRNVDITTDVRHAGGTTVDLGTAGFSLISQWVRNGHTRTGSPPRDLRVSEGPCTSGAGTAPGYDPASMPDADFGEFVASVQPVLRATCAGNICHGNRNADLYLSCGDTPEELHWNHWVAMQFVSESPSISELLRRPLAKDRGGTFHEGGTVLPSTDDARYQAMFHWAQSLTPTQVAPVIPPGYSAEGLRFFANRVQPVMIRKGCMFLNCHSPSMFHDLRLRGGSGGHFGRLATIRNYDLARALLAVDAENPNESRLIAKNLFPSTTTPAGMGIAHRGGSLLEDFSNMDGTTHTATPADCDMYTDDQLDHSGDLNTIPAYCIFARWHEIERNIAHPGIDTAHSVSDLVWVNRPSGVGRPDDFDTYRPGASLRIASATLSRTVPLALSGERDLAAGCGFPAGAADIRGPTATWDGTGVAFAARTSATSAYRLYQVALDGTGCAPIPGIAPASDSASGILMHDFDPAFAPDGRLVWASSRGYLDDHAVHRAGPTRTPASLAPNANLFARDTDGTVRQLTFLLNQEMQPSFMGDGRLIFTAEKREREFHQFAGRRENLDGGDYHPLFAQRESVGFRSATEISEMLDRNLVFVAAPLDAIDGAGGIALVNRSIGPDQDDRDPADRQYIHSMRFPVGSALTAGSTGAFRSPAPLPNGHIVASCVLSATSLTSGTLDFRLCDIDLDRGTAVEIGGGSGANIEAVAVFPREPHPVFRSTFFEVNGHTEVHPGEQDAVILYADFPLLGTLLFANRRTGRPIDFDIGGFDVMESLPPPDGVTTFADAAIAASVQTDAFGQFFVQHSTARHVDLAADGSAQVQVRGGASIQVRPTDHAGTPLVFPAGGIFTGEMLQREAVQFYPGEHVRQAMPRAFFNPLCGGCHGSISGRELDTAVDVDVLTRASPSILSLDEMPVDTR